MKTLLIVHHTVTGGTLQMARAAAAGAAGEPSVRTLLRHAAETMAGALLPLLSDTPERRLQVEAFARLDRIMDIGGPAPSDRAAALVLQSSGGI